MRGKVVYARACATCHGADGLGVLRNRALPNFGYLMPPLGGRIRFNDGAGMSRLITAANFVHYNMPNGTSYTKPRVMTQDAWDVAAYVI